MRSQVKKIGYAGMLVLLVLWWMGNAEGGGGDGKSLVGRLKSMYLSLQARMGGVEKRMDGVEQRMGGVEKRMGGVEQRMSGVEKQVVDVKEVSKRSNKQAGLAEADAKDAKAKAHSAEQRANQAEKQAKQANERADQAEKRFGKLQGSVQRLQGQLAQQMHAFQAYRRLFAKEEAARIAEEAARIAEEAARTAEEAARIAATKEDTKEKAEAQKRKAGEQKLFKRGGAEFKARWVPAGKFMMGSPESDNEAQSNEKPQREVELTRGFWMMETEVTQAQYKAVMGENSSCWLSCGDNCPVENVTWHEVALFANKLSEAMQLPQCFTCKGVGKKAYCEARWNKGSDYIGCKGWRLPTEAEWEYAARAGTTTSRYGAVDAVGWYRGNSGGKTQPVGQKQPNAWGLYDMLGNVLEWVYDGYDDSAYTKLGAVDPVHVADTSIRMIRGGGWNNDAMYSRAASRFNYAPKESDCYLGFRLLRR